MLKEPPTAEGIAFLRALNVHLDESDPRRVEIDKLSDCQAAPPVCRCTIVVAAADFVAQGEKQLSVKKGQRLAVPKQQRSKASLLCMTLSGEQDSEAEPRYGRVPAGFLYTDLHLRVAPVYGFFRVADTEPECIEFGPECSCSTTLAPPPPESPCAALAAPLVAALEESQNTSGGRLVITAV